MELPDIQAEIARLTERVSELERQKAALDAKIAPLRQELEHWTGIARLRSGPGPTPTFSIRTTPEGRKIIVHLTQQKYGDKAQRMREFVFQHAAEGVTIRELTEFTVNQLQGHKNMSYRWVARMMEANPPRLEKRGEKIFPTQHLFGIRRSSGVYKTQKEAAEAASPRA